MRKHILALAVLAAISLPTIAQADVAYNIGAVSSYQFRGLTNSAAKPAIQGGIDWTSKSGLYAGTWASNQSWLEDGGYYKGTSLELDFYGGYRNTIGPVAYDVGVTNYYYPGSKTDLGANTSAFASPFTTEAYGSLTYDVLQAKVSYSVTNLYGTANSNGSYYLELNANIPVPQLTGVTANLHYGYQYLAGSTEGVSNSSLYSYNDWKAGVTKSLDNGLSFGGYVTGSSAKDAGYTYLGKNIGDTRLTAFVQKTF